MFQKTLALIALTLSLSTTAATVSYNGYELDTETNVVTGGDLEWLRWDLTVGQTREAALATYSPSGFRIASNTEVANLLNAFPFGVTVSDDPLLGQRNVIPRGSIADQAADQIIELFGYTYRCDSGWVCGGAPDPREYAEVMFGEDDNNDGRISTLLVDPSFHGYDKEPFNYQPTDGQLNLGSSQIDWSHPTASFVLVRPSEVPIPAAAWLFGSALLGLGVIKRKKA